MANGAEGPKRVDFLKPMVLMYAGIVASSVAILIAFIAATAGKEFDSYRPVFAQAMAPMAVVVVVSTLTVILLQGLRAFWQLAPAGFEMKNTKPSPGQKWAFWIVSGFVFAAGGVLAVVPGYMAVRYVVTGSLNVAKNEEFNLPLCQAQRDELSWVLWWFYQPKMNDREKTAFDERCAREAT